MKALKLRPEKLSKIQEKVQGVDKLFVPWEEKFEKTKNISFFWRGYGEVKINKNFFETVEIESLVENWTWDELGEYVEKYGDFCALDQMGCFIMNESYIALSKRRKEISKELQEWFRRVFNLDLMGLMQFGPFFSFNILAFENILVSKFEYNRNTNVSISQFIIQKFGFENCEKLKKELIEKEYGT